jgi:hypothetical protein
MRGARHWFSVVTATFAIAAASHGTVAQAQETARRGIIAGVVRDEAGAALGEVELRVAGAERTARTATDGSFRLDSVPVGEQELVVRKIGYVSVRTTLRIPADSAILVAIVLVENTQALDEVRVSARQRNALGGTVIDSAGRPMAGVGVTVFGAGLEAVTDSAGQFIFTDVPTGSFLLQARMAGFQLAQHAVRMREGLERNVTLRLRAGGRALTERDLGNARIMARESATRLAMRRRTGTAVISRDELATMGRAPLDFALGQSTGSAVFRMTAADQYCVLVDGIRALGLEPADTSKGEAAAGSMLRSFFAHEVELVEVFSPNADDSRTLCGRFAKGSQCECPPKGTPPAIAIWLRK